MIYQFEHIETGEVRDVVLSMNEEKIYNGENGTETGLWRRVFTAPNISVDSQINPYDSKAFVEKTRNMKGKYGDLLDMSKEMSEKRGGSEDPIKKKYLSDWSKKRAGRVHPEQRPKEITI